MSAGRPPVNEVSSSMFRSEPEKPLTAPKHLNAAERAIWRETLRANPHINHACYSSLLETFCGAIARRRKAAALLEKEGLTVVAPNGAMKAHPAAQVIGAAETAIASLAVKLSLAVSTRKEVGREVKPEVLPTRNRSLRGLRLA